MKYQDLVSSNAYRAVSNNEVSIGAIPITKEGL